MSLDRYCHGNQDPHKSLQPIRSSNSRSRLPRDQRSTTESTEIHGKENANQLPLSVSFRVFSGFQFVMIFLAVVISCKDVVRRPNLVSRTSLNHEPWDAGNTARCFPAEGRQGPGPAGSLGSARVLDHGYGPLSRPARDLLSDAHFTWGERRVTGVIALVTLGGCGLAGWMLGQLFRIFAQVLDVLADGAEAAWCRRPDRAALGSDPGAHCPGLGRKGWLCRTASRARLIGRPADDPPPQPCAVPS